VIGDDERVVEGRVAVMLAVLYLIALASDIRRIEQGVMKRIPILHSINLAN